MKKDQQLQNIQQYIYKIFQKDVTGHDFFHMERVAKMAKHIAVQNNADPFICEVSGWVHDIGDYKLFNDPEKELEKLADFLTSIQFDSQDIERIFLAVKDVSFSKGDLIPETIEGKIVQDADRLDALGAIGIARTFAYGGIHGQLIYHPQRQKGTSIEHFYDKLLKLRYSMNTTEGAKIAEERHLILTDFLESFFEEWNSYE